MRIYLWVSLLWLLSTVSTSAHAQAQACALRGSGPVPSVQKPYFKGTGCPQSNNSVDLYCEVDKQQEYLLQIDLVFRHFYISLSDGAQTKNCAVMITIDSPNPVRYALSASYFSGTSNLAANERAWFSFDFGIVGTDKRYYQSMHSEQP